MVLEELVIGSTGIILRTCSTAGDDQMSNDRPGRLPTLRFSGILCPGVYSGLTISVVGSMAGNRKGEDIVSARAIRSREWILYHER